MSGFCTTVFPPSAREELGASLGGRRRDVWSSARNFSNKCGRRDKRWYPPEGLNGRHQNLPETHGIAAIKMSKVDVERARAEKVDLRELCLPSNVIH
eukprot:scaffold302_cov247-Pinguiococcus_pyrenoidosus.AAC.21